MDEKKEFVYYFVFKSLIGSVKVSFFSNKLFVGFKSIHSVYVVNLKIKLGELNQNSCTE